MDNGYVSACSVERNNGILSSGHARDTDNRETMRQNLEIVLLVDTETFNVRGGGWRALSNIALT